LSKVVGGFILLEKELKVHLLVECIWEKRTCNTHILLVYCKGVRKLILSL